MLSNRQPTRGPNALRAALYRESGFVQWPIATGGALTANRRFRGIADMDRFSSRNDL
jgi:hypothetical protein